MNFFKLIKGISLLTLITIFSSNAKAQFAESIASGRPGQANGPFSVGSKIYQLQSGFDYLSNRIEGSDFEREQTQSAFNTLFRIGLSEKYEFRTSFNYNFSDEVRFTKPESKNEISGISDLTLGLRRALFTQKGILPAFAIQYTAKFGGIDQYQSKSVTSELKLIAQHKFSDKTSLNSNIMVNWQENSSPNYPYVLSFNYQLTEKLSSVYEAYGVITSDQVSILYDLGLAYLINQDMQVDIYGGMANNDLPNSDLTDHSWFISIGYSYRLNKR